MGATIITGISAGIYLHRDGTPLYVIFEQTFEKNVYPHCPNWSPVCIGDRNTAIERTFYSGAAFEGGCAQSPNGPILPETYIRRALDAVERPALYEGIIATELPGRWADDELRSDIAAFFREIDRPDLSFDIEAGRTVRIAIDELPSQHIGRLFGGTRNSVCGAWRTNASHSKLTGVPPAGVTPEPDDDPDTKIPAYSAKRVFEDSNHAFREGVFLSDGVETRYFNTRYQAMQQVVESAAALECRKKGSGLAAIRAARKALSEAAVMSEGEEILIGQPSYEQVWARERFSLFLRTMGLPSETASFKLKVSRIRCLHYTDLMDLGNFHMEAA